MHRAGRPFYWVMVGVWAAIGIACYYLVDDHPSPRAFLIGVFIAPGIDRFHDLGRSGKWVLAMIALSLLAVIPLKLLGYSKEIQLWAWCAIAGFELVTLGLLPGQPGANRYGQPDRAVAI